MTGDKSESLKEILKTKDLKEMRFFLFRHFVEQDANNPEEAYYKYIAVANAAQKKFASGFRWEVHPRVGVRTRPPRPGEAQPVDRVDAVPLGDRERTHQRPGALRVLRQCHTEAVTRAERRSGLG